MAFAHDTDVALKSAAALINTLPTGAADTDRLTTRADLEEFLRREEFTGSRTHEDPELQAVRRLRTRLRLIWTSTEAEAVEQLNAILRDSNALPQLVKHDHWDWHLHATTPEAPLEVRMAVEAAMALVDVVRSKEMDRLRVCAAEDCTAIVVDLSKNRSKLYCETGNCANRAHVRAYRERRSGAGAR